MGGPTSGRWLGAAKRRTVEDCLAIDLRDLRKMMLLVPGTSTTKRVSWSRDSAEVGSLWLELDLTTPAAAVATLEYGSCEYRVALSSMALGFGGARWWWRCPGCCRRARVLLLPPASSRFLCRGCHKLTYWVCQRSHTAAGALWRELRGR